MTTLVRLQSAPFDPGEELNRFNPGQDNVGAVASFVGLVRSTKDNPITAMTLEHYPELADKQLQRLAAQAVEQFGLSAVTIIHRFGTLKVDEPIVMVMTASGHRKAALDAVEMIMDVLKTDAPFWKKEHGTGDAWVEAKASDDAARDRWRG